MQLNGELVSRAKGEYAGPCPFTGQGTDRFHWWSHDNKWWCRKTCTNCPGKPARWGMWGWLDQQNLDADTTIVPQQTPTPPMSQALGYAQRLDDEVLEYLNQRGIRPDTARRFLVGKNSHRLTVPNVIKTKSGTHCMGIKKRWIGPPPEDWIARYVVEPGSRGSSIFNWNRLIQRPKDIIVVVEGILDVVLLDQLGITAVAPFGGGGVWRAEWAKWFARAREVLVVADNDDAGQDFADRKQELLGRGKIVLPPGEAKDIGEAWQGGENITAWVRAMA